MTVGFVPRVWRGILELKLTEDIMYVSTEIGCNLNQSGNTAGNMLQTSATISAFPVSRKFVLSA